MRVLVATDSFGGTLSALEASEVIARGWRSSSPHDVVRAFPLADGGPGFLAAVAKLPNAQLWKIKVRGPLGDEIDAELCMIEDTIYIESAMACGRQLAPGAGSPGVRNGSTFGVGELLAHAISIAGVRRIVIGLGGSVTNDGGSGLLAALGCQPDSLLTSGGAGLGDLPKISLEQARAKLAGIDLVIATDVDNPLLGPQGASEVYAPQKGATASDVVELERALAHFAEMTDPSLAGAAGAGAAGGLGFGLLLLGGRRVSGIDLVARALHLDEEIAASDIVVTGEGSFDWQSLRGKVIAGVAHFAAKYGKPVVVIAGQVRCARREYLALGVESAYAVAETPIEINQALADPIGTLQRRAESVARTWSPPPSSSLQK